MTVDSGLCGMGKWDVYQLVTNSSWGLFVNDGDGSPRGICNTVPGAVGPMQVPVPCFLSGVALNVDKLFSCISDRRNTIPTAATRPRKATPPKVPPMIALIFFLRFGWA